MSCVLLAGLALSMLQGKDSFPDTPENHWAYQAMGDLHSVGVAQAFPVFLGRGVRPSSRYELAVSTHMSFTLLREDITAFETVNDQTTRTILKLVKPMRATIEDDLVRLTRCFSGELQSLGVDTFEMIGQIHADCTILANMRVDRLGEAQRQFSDVPENHWAAKATKDLRAAGILVGYPSGRFTKP